MQSPPASLARRRAVFDHSERECKNERAYTALIGALSRVRMHDEAVATLKVCKG
jgi:hypothetical protein